MSVHRVYSRGATDLLLHAWSRFDQPSEDRTNLSPDAEFLQVSMLHLAAGQRVPPHLHVKRPADAPAPPRTQECWIVIRGLVVATLFDTDGQPLSRVELPGGTILVTFNGGHAMECPDGDTVMLEVKTGPYLGRDYTVIAGATAPPGS